MFATFKMELPDFPRNILDEYYNVGLETYNSYKQTIKSSLNKYLSTDGVLKASEIANDWFPNVKADIFLSHSHKDEKKAIALAGYLNKLGLRVFIDSCVWGYANDLLRQIDEKYCVLNKNPDGSVNLYDYQKRNESTTHVHMILNGALMKMIDNTECLIFLDTPNSVKVQDISKGVTDSGWLYSELLMSSCLQKKSPVRKKFMHGIRESFENNALRVEYDADISHLIIISMNDICLAARKSGSSGTAILDQMYLLKKIYNL